MRLVSFSQNSGFVFMHRHLFTDKHTQRDMDKQANAQQSYTHTHACTHTHIPPPTVPIPLFLTILYSSRVKRCLSLDVQESISTCRFAQRVAMIKNDVLLNEELDPKLMIAKLQRTVQELRQELAMLTSEQRTDELTEDDLLW